MSADLARRWAPGVPLEDEGQPCIEAGAAARQALEAAFGPAEPLPDFRFPQGIGDTSWQANVFPDGAMHCSGESGATVFGDNGAGT